MQATKTPVKKGVRAGVKKTGKGKKEVLKFVIDCAQPARDGILDAAAFEKFLHDRVKVNGKVNNLGENIKISRDEHKLTVVSNLPFSKRYLKYLSKKFLKKHQLRDWLHVVATSKSDYELKYFQLQDDEEEEAE